MRLSESNRSAACRSRCTRLECLPDHSLHRMLSQAYQNQIVILSWDTEHWDSVRSDHFLVMASAKSGKSGSYNSISGGLYAATWWGEPEQCQMIQLFIGLVEKLVGPEVASCFSPPGIKHASDLPQHLQEAGFKDVTSTPYSHPLVFILDDLVTFLLSPQGQFGAMLDKLEASGRTGIHQTAQQILKGLCQERMLLKNNIVTLENTSFLYTGVKP